MLELKAMPLLPGQNNGRSISQVPVENLKSIGVTGSAFSVHTGDVIQFPEGDPLVVSQKINANDPQSNLAYYVGCIRNGKNSWLAVGQLTRRDATGAYVGKFQEEMGKYPSFQDVYAALAGKSIKGGEMVEKEFAVFDNGVRTDRTQKRMICEIEWA